MIDLANLRANPALYQTACDNKGIKLSVDEFLKFDEQYRSQKQQFEELRAEQNVVSKEIPQLKGDDKQAKLVEMKALADQIKGVSAELKETENTWQEQQLLLPNPPLDQVPVGKTDADNIEVRVEGEIPTFTFTPKSHAELGEELDLFDVERGVKIAGSRSYFLKGAGARLQHAVLQLAIDILTEQGFTLFDCPHIVLEDAMTGTGYFPGGEESAYALDQRDEGSFLIGTSEVSVASYHQDEILDPADLPKLYAGYSPCYRREAGTYGKDTQGLYRVHQFYKVEQVAICINDVNESARIHKLLLSNAEELLKRLELPYRVVDVCTGDMGQGQVYKNDIEAWMPSRQSYGETHSCSTFYEFQARRLKIRYKDQSGKNQFCHTLNNTCVASPRILIPILELYQTAEGSVRVPAALQKYMGGLKLVEKN